MSAMINNTRIPIVINYTDQELRILVEEFIAMQCSEFSFKNVCSFVLYRAMEEGRTVGDDLFESEYLNNSDCERIGVVLAKIINEGRVTNTAGKVGAFTYDTKFKKSIE